MRTPRRRHSPDPMVHSSSSAVISMRSVVVGCRPSICPKVRPRRSSECGFTPTGVGSASGGDSSTNSSNSLPGSRIVRRVVLDTNDSLTEAIAMYGAMGYEPTERYDATLRPALVHEIAVAARIAGGCSDALSVHDRHHAFLPPESDSFSTGSTLTISSMPIAARCRPCLRHGGTRPRRRPDRSRLRHRRRPDREARTGYIRPLRRRAPQLQGNRVQAARPPHRSR